MKTTAHFIRFCFALRLICVIFVHYMFNNQIK